MKSILSKSSIVVLLCHIDEVGVGDGLPEDEGLVIHLSDCLVGWIVERL